MYEFNLMKPPLLRDHLDVLSIPPDSLKRLVGSASWSDSNEVRVSDIVLNWIRTDNNYNMKRILRWVRVEYPIHYEVEVKLKTTETRGYKRTDKETIEKSLNIDVSGSIPFANLKANIKADLKITEDSTQEWREEYSKTIDFTYEKDTTYIGWKLLDSVFVNKITNVSSLFSSSKSVTGTSKTEENTVLDIALNYYQDSKLDEDAKTFAALLNNVNKNIV